MGSLDTILGVSLFIHLQTSFAYFEMEVLTKIEDQMQLSDAKFNHYSLHRSDFCEIVSRLYVSHVYMMFLPNLLRS